jgi:hypothetical protein
LLLILIPVFQATTVKGNILAVKSDFKAFSFENPGKSFISSDYSASISSYYNNTELTLFYAIPAPPTITCPGNIIQAADAGLCSANVNGLSAIINDPDGDITTLTWAMTGATTAASPLTGINNLASFVFNVGVTTFTYTVTDAALNSVSCNFVVTVNDTQLPVVICPADINTTFAAGDCDASVTTGTATASDNCGILAGSISGIRSDALALNAPYPSGVTTITWSATDIHGNIGTCIQKVTVTKSVLLVNYNFLGATGYPISPNQSAGGISCEATSSEPFFIDNSVGTATGPLAFVDNLMASPAIYLSLIHI